MDAEYLSEDELNYELKIRRLLEVGDSMDKKKRKLKQILKESTVRPMTLLYDPTTECADLDNKIVSTENILKIEKNLKDVALMRQCYSSLHHCKVRINCLQSLALDSRDLNNYSERIDKAIEEIKSLKHVKKFLGIERKPKEPVYRKINVNALESDLLTPGDKKKLEEALALTESLVSKAGLNSTSKSSSDAESSSESESYFSDDTIVSYHNPEPVIQRKAQSADNLSKKLVKWDLKFDGDKSKLLDFLNDVKIMAETEKISEVGLHQIAYHLFTGEGKKWYKAFRKSITSWKALVGELKKNFLPKDHDYHELKSIENHMQSENESFLSFYSNMELMFSRLSYEISEAEKLTILRRNMAQVLRTSLSTKKISSISKLLSLAKIIENENSVTVSNTHYNSRSRENFHVAEMDANFQAQTFTEAQENFQAEVNVMNTGFNENRNFSRNFQQNRNQNSRNNFSNGQQSQNFDGPSTSQNVRYQTNFQNNTNPTHPQSNNSRFIPNNNSNSATNNFSSNFLPTQYSGQSNSVNSSSSFQQPNSYNQQNNLQHFNPNIPPPSSQRVNPNIVCFRCKQTGHPFQLCQVMMPHITFCYRCGLHNVISPNCPRCMNTGNGQ